MPIFARDLLNVGPTGLGALLGAPAVGAIAGSLVVMTLGDPRSKARLIVTVTLLYTAGVVAFALSRSFMLSLAITFALGALDAVGETLRMTVIQLMTPDELRGRVQAVGFRLSRSGDRSSAGRDRLRRVAARRDRRASCWAARSRPPGRGMARAIVLRRATGGRDERAPEAGAARCTRLTRTRRRAA
jgi:hypothetical protein